MGDRLQEKTSTLIRSEAVNKKINNEKQSKHIKDNAGYIQGRSYLLPGIDPQNLINDYHGTGESWHSKDGIWKNKETICVNDNIGVNVDPLTSKETATNRFTIHYSKTGSHIVPSERID